MDRHGKKGGDILKAQSQSADFVTVAFAFTRQGSEAQILSPPTRNFKKSRSYAGMALLLLELVS
jgi:hypothetical protein